MPLYEYRCKDCEGRFEVLTRFAERDQAHACPSCSSSQTRVLVSTFAMTGGERPGGLDFGSGGGCCGGSCGCGGATKN